MRHHLMGGPPLSADQQLLERRITAGLAMRIGQNPIDPRVSETAQRDQADAAEEAHRRGFDRLSLLDVAAESLRVEGIDTLGMAKGDIITRAMSTAALSNVLSAVVNKQVHDAYQEAPDPTAGWCREVDRRDFRLNTATMIGKISTLGRVPRGGNASHVTVADTPAETYKVFRWAGQFVIDEQDILDDDAGALQMIPAEMGAAAKRVRPALILSLILANPTMADGVDLFHASSHGGNLIVNALDAAGLKAAIAVLGKQTMSGVTLNLKPGFLVVPQDLDFDARTLLNSTHVVTGADVTMGSTNTLRAIADLRSDNRLGVAGVTDPISGTHHAGTATNWLLCADQPGIEVGYLAGTGRMPVVREFVLTQGQYGIAFDCKLDVGAQVFDYRPMVFSTGAGS